MIITASRRTDIPAFHSEWFMNRLRAGTVLVRNPVHRTTVHRVDLGRSNVDCIVFVTKDPRPMVPHLREIGSMGHVCLFHVTMTPYGRGLEPGVPFKADVNDACIGISDRIGRDRMVWRYDPVIFGPGMGIDYHRRKFSMMCREVSEWTDRCVVSFLDVYGKLNRLVEDGTLRRVTRAEEDAFAEMVSEVAGDHGMTVTGCCTDRDMSDLGILRRGCLDRGTMRSLDIPYETGDGNLRDGCLCVRSIDIGQYDTCMHDCVYCYANRADGGHRTAKVYDPTAEMLWDRVRPRDTVVDIRTRGCTRLEDHLHPGGDNP
ncbi:MAG: DUF1848 domain-containing protein [Candidatus Methanomethylophilaceae archaeon]|nr:DUF1848 domain-containing protein [Candidatus Methanomethylophilaceae archaeon]